MLERLAHAMGVSTTVAAILIALVAAQVTLQVFGLVDLARRDAVRGGKKWVWALVIALGNLVGAIVYLLVGRTPAESDISGAPSGARVASGDAARRAVDTLYGPRDQQ